MGRGVLSAGDRPALPWHDCSTDVERRAAAQHPSTAWSLWPKRCAALNDIAVVAPDWLRALAPAEWHDRYDRRIEEMRLPEAGPKRDAFVGQVGTDCFRLLDALAGADVPLVAATLTSIETRRRVWARHFERVEGAKDGGARLRPAQGRGPGDRVESPYDTEARFRTKASTTWTGYMVHFTETCDEGALRLVVHADTTPANVHEAPRTGPIHVALVART